MRGAREPHGSDLRALEHGSDCLGTVDADTVVVETARGDVDLRKQVRQWVLTRNRTLYPGEAAHLSEVSAVAEGSSSLNTMAPGRPTPLPRRSSSVMLFSRSMTSGMWQKSIIAACSSTAIAKLPAASPTIKLLQTLQVRKKTKGS